MNTTFERQKGSEIHISIWERNRCFLSRSWLYRSQLPLPSWLPTPNMKFLWKQPKTERKFNRQDIA